MEKTLQSMQGAGVKVLRTWGFNAINGSELAGALQSGLTYYQVWNSSQWALNDGPQGLQRLDHVIETAAKYDIRGAELYINWIAGSGQTHDVFYTNPEIVSSYQSYVRTIVERYKNSPNIFAWELMNEARCAGDLLPSGPSCVAGSETLLKWYEQQSNFVRTLDPFHMITTGGEGHFFWQDPPEYWFDGTLVSDFNFNGQAGEDFDRNLGLSNIDFGTYDFPGSNFSVEEWGLGWIEDHARSASNAGKPVILEEFGLSGLVNKSSIYPTWVNRALDTNHAGIMPWQFGQLHLTEDGGNRIIKYTDALNHGASPNDGKYFEIY
ncbi:hypothetical protein PHLCEN_2v11575 [Hermanssonia centrifuga]|uniref:mannan endo-1,4-beta-mannosidase n=1 Tax=Hermanssonia centrifuga TaxID=98765 RepID=A0A2R6NKR0_9APHY|nr:hypothetical protein PHLCEN_2v11575 [Hermanssonia centrifuga]